LKQSGQQINFSVLIAYRACVAVVGRTKDDYMESAFVYRGSDAAGDAAVHYCL